MKAPDIPDYVSPIVGYRAWDWGDTGLRSLNGEAWVPDRALTARCPKTDHEPPADSCSCGVYAAKSHRHLQDISSSTVAQSYVHGEVYLWGKVVEHNLGYRAQFAYPKTLVLPSNIEPLLETSRLEPLIAYGADISLPPDILLWTKASGYTPTGFDWLIEMRRQWCKWCKKWHWRTLQLGDCVTVLGRGIGFVEPDDGFSDCVCVRLKNNDLFIVPDRGIVWNCENSRWEVDLSGYREAVILPQRKGWKVLCASRKGHGMGAFLRFSNWMTGAIDWKSAWKPFVRPVVLSPSPQECTTNPVQHRISTPPTSREESSTLRRGLRGSRDATTHELLCDHCHERPAIGYTTGWVFPDSVSTYCRVCAKGVQGLIFFAQRTVE